MVQLVLVHGVGGARPTADWLKSLNARLAAMDFPMIVESTDSIIVPSYGGLFDTSEASEPPVTYQAASDRTEYQHHLDHLVRQKALERVVRPYAESTDMWWSPSDVPAGVANPLIPLVEFFGFDEVRRYVQSSAVRHAVWGRVLSQLPRSGRVIVVAHSLGSVVTSSLLRRLPPALTIDLLVTIGSPLGFPRYRSHLGPLTSQFPYSRVQRWLNVYSPWDGVTGGRGISGAFPQAVDVCAHVDGDHGFEAYLSHPAVAAAIGSVAFPRQREDGTTRSAPGRIPARPLHPSWGPLLLGTAFTRQLSKSLPSDQWRKFLRLETARREVARRAVANIETQRSRRAVVIAQLQAQGASLDDEQLHDHPLADRRYPTFRDLTDDAAALLSGAWTDQDLLPLAVGLMLQPLVDPFDVQADMSSRLAALEHTLNVVRRSPRGNLPDQSYAGQVRASVDWAKKRLADDGKFPWGTVLIASGLAVLAATGVGLAVAAPAGLAGAAVVTSTLAAFGPGGMVGGLVTLGAMTGTAGALGGLGTAAEAGGTARERARAGAAEQTGRELAALDLATLTVTLTGMLAVVHAQTQLEGFTSTETYVRTAVASGLDIVRAEYHLHQQVAPDTDGTKEWGRQVILLERAINALDALTSSPAADLLRIARAAVESGKPPAMLPEPSAPPSFPGPNAE